MFWSFCAPKAGAGTSVLAAATACELSTRLSGRRVVLVDLCGDQADLLGVDCEGKPGVVDWLQADHEVTADAIDHLLIDVVPGLSLLPSGPLSISEVAGRLDPARSAQLGSAFDSFDLVVADVGTLPRNPLSPQALIAVSGTHTTAVVRACYLALRRAARLPIDVDSLVEVVEAGRSLTTLDIELVMNMGVSSRVKHDPVVARSVDAGLLVSRRPRQLRRSVGVLIDQTLATAEFESAA